jgi:hypothetical protein
MYEVSRTKILEVNMNEFGVGSTIKLVKKAVFKEDAFTNIKADARKVINEAQPNDILALTITANSPLNIIQARIFTRRVFDEILASD